MHPHLQMNQNIASANAHAKSALPWNLGILQETPGFQDSKIDTKLLPILSLKHANCWGDFLFEDGCSERKLLFLDKKSIIKGKLLLEKDVSFFKVN